MLRGYAAPVRSVIAFHCSSTWCRSRGPSVATRRATRPPPGVRFWPAPDRQGELSSSPTSKTCSRRTAPSGRSRGSGQRSLFDRWPGSWSSRRPGSRPLMRIPVSTVSTASTPANRSPSWRRRTPSAPGGAVCCQGRVAATLGTSRCWPQSRRSTEHTLGEGRSTSRHVMACLRMR
jgi:hypothetical protein